MKVFGEILVSVSLCPPQIPQELASVILGMLSLKSLLLRTHKGCKYRLTFNNIQRVKCDITKDVCISVQEDTYKDLKCCGQSMDLLHSHNLYGPLMLDVRVIKTICIMNNIHNCNFQQILH